MQLAQVDHLTLAMPLYEAVNALRSLPPGTELKEPADADLRVVAAALRSVPASDKWLDWVLEQCARSVAISALRAELAALEGAVIGYSAAASAGARHVELTDLQAQLVDLKETLDPQSSGDGFSHDIEQQLERIISNEPFRVAAVQWARSVGFEVLADTLLAAPRDQIPKINERLTTSEVESVAVNAISESIPRPRKVPQSAAVTQAQDNVVVNDVAGVRLRVDRIVMGAWGFLIPVLVSKPSRTTVLGNTIASESSLWNGLSSVTDDHGYHYLIFGRAEHSSGSVEGINMATVLHWCYPTPFHLATVLNAKSGGCQVQRISFEKDASARPPRLIEEVPSSLVVQAYLRD